MIICAALYNRTIELENNAVQQLQAANNHVVVNPLNMEG